MIASKRIVIADDDERLVDALAWRCESYGLRVERAYDGMAALQSIAEHQPNLVILDVNMPGGSGLSVCKMVSRDLHRKAIPIIMLTGPNDAETIHLCNDRLAHCMSKGPNFWVRLDPLILGLLDLDAPNQASAGEPRQGVIRRADDGHCGFEADTTGRTGKPLPRNPEQEPGTEASSPAVQERIQGQCVADPCCVEPASDQPFLKTPRVLCIDDDPDVSKAIKVRLEGYGIAVTRAFSGMQGYWTGLDFRPDAIIIDLAMPDGDGKYITARFRSHTLTANVPLIVLSGERNPAIKRELLSLGAKAYLTKPLVFEELIRTLREHIQFPTQTVLSAPAKAILRDAKLP